MVAAEARTGIAGALTTSTPRTGRDAAATQAARARNPRRVESIPEAGKRRLPRNNGACPLISLPQKIQRSAVSAVKAENVNDQIYVALRVVQVDGPVGSHLDDHKIRHRFKR